MESTYYSVREQVGAILPKDKIQVAENGTTYLVMEARNITKKERFFALMDIHTGERYEMAYRRDKKIIMWLKHETEVKIASWQKNHFPEKNWEDVQLPIFNELADRLANA